MWVFAVAGLVLGAIAGSFLATVLIRWPQERSALRGRSQCDGCGATLRAGELVPVLSYALARGRCRRCGAAIDPRHLAVELGAAFIGCVALAAHPGVLGFVTASFGWWLLLLAALDAEHHWLPDGLTLPLAPAGILVGWAGYGAALEDRVIGAAAGFLLLTGIAFLYRRIRGREGLGAGDPKFFSAIGAWLGWQQLPLVLLGAGMIGLAAILMIGMRGGTVSATDRMPLGTLMALAAWPIWLLTAA